MIEGVEKLKLALRKAGAAGPTAMAAGLYREAGSIMADAKERAPVYTGPPGAGKPEPGVLRASGHVEHPSVRGGHVEVVLGFGGAASDYALVQHERMDYNHEIGGPKYLEGPAMEHVSGMEARLAGEVHKFLERR